MHGTRFSHDASAAFRPLPVLARVALYGALKEALESCDDDDYDAPPNPPAGGEVRGLRPRTPSLRSGCARL